MPKIGKTRIFLKHWALSIFNPYWPLTSCKKSEKILWFNEKARRTEVQNDGRTAGWHWIHKTSLLWVQNEHLYNERYTQKINRQQNVYNLPTDFSLTTSKMFIPSILTNDADDRVVLDSSSPFSSFLLPLPLTIAPSVAGKLFVSTIANSTNTDWHQRASSSVEMLTKLNKSKQK